MSQISQLLEGLDLSRFLLPGLQLAQLAIQERIEQIQNGNGAKKKRGRPKKVEVRSDNACQFCGKVFEEPNLLRKIRVHERLVHDSYVSKRRKHPRRVK